MRKAKFVGVLFLVCFFGVFVYSGTTGKISGRVINKKTGEPIPGANIILEGTFLGAASGEDGNYTILYVTPGTYTIVCDVIGYKKVTVSDVVVHIDQTTIVNFELEEETLKGEVVTVVYKRKAVKKDVYTSVASVSEKEVSRLPVSSVTEVVELQAGVESGMVIRGGEASEALFMVDGITLRDPRNNRPITGMALSAVKEVSIERGGFSAEYGQVRSGVVNVVTREGRKDGYSGSITFRYSPPARKYEGISPYNPNSFWLRPYLDPEVCWEGTEEWDYFTRRQYPSFEGWNAVSQRLLTDNDPTNDLTPMEAQRLFLWQHRRREKNNIPDYDIDLGIGGPVPLVSDKLGNLRFFASYRKKQEALIVPLSLDRYIDYNWSVKLTSDLTSKIKLNFSAMWGRNFNVSMNEAGLDYNANYVRTPEEITGVLGYPQPSRVSDSRIFCNSFFSRAKVSFQTFAVRLTNMLSSGTYYEMSIEHVKRAYETGPIARRDTSKKYEFAPGKFTDESPFGFNPYPEPGIDGMMTGAHTSTARDSSKVASTTFKFSLTSQVNFYNLVKTGLELVYNDLDMNYSEYKLLYGSSFYRMKKHPIRGAFYIQDKIETEGFIINAGLRVDYDNPNTRWPAPKQFERGFFSAAYVPSYDVKMKDVKGKFFLSPRLGISHPITETSKLFFNYGHFQQLAPYEHMYRLVRDKDNQLLIFGDPGMKMERTVAYELGYDQSIKRIFLIQIAAFYRDISNERGYVFYQSADGTVAYNKESNNMYRDIRGFEVTLRKMGGRWLRGFVNYTYQVTTRGHFGKMEIYEDLVKQQEYDRQTRNLYQERPIPQPYARGSITLAVPSDFGSGLVNTLVADLNLNLLVDWRSGAWITWNPKKKLNVAQNVKMKDWFNARLRLSKTFKLSKVSVTLFADVNNVFNYKVLNLNSFYDINDYLDYFNSLHLPESDDYENIVGNDRPGDYRKPGVPYQPIIQVGDVNTLGPDQIMDNVIYYDSQMGEYMEYRNNGWVEVDKKRMDKILKDKAYIDMPNLTSFHFINPRDIFFGITISF